MKRLIACITVLSVQCSHVRTHQLADRLPDRQSSERVAVSVLLELMNGTSLPAPGTSKDVDPYQKRYQVDANEAFSVVFPASLDRENRDKILLSLEPYTKNLTELRDGDFETAWHKRRITITLDFKLVGPSEAIVYGSRAAGARGGEYFSCTVLCENGTWILRRIRCDGVS